MRVLACSLHLCRGVENGSEGKSSIVVQKLVLSPQQTSYWCQDFIIHSKRLGYNSCKIIKNKLLIISHFIKMYIAILKFI